MTKLLTLDEMLDCLEMIGDGSAPIFARQLEAVGDHMAAILGARLNVETGVTHREESAFAGTCCAFLPKSPGQPCPYPLDNFDETEWDDADPRTIRRATLEAARDSYVIGAPNGAETPDPEGWAREYQEEADELERLTAELDQPA